MEVLITSALGMGQMDQGSLRQFIAESACVCECVPMLAGVTAGKCV